MVDQKKWYLSRTVWSASVSVLATMGAMLGLPLGSVDQAVLTEAVLQLVAAISGVGAIFGRLSATHRLE